MMVDLPVEHGVSKAILRGGAGVVAVVALAAAVFFFIKGYKFAGWASAYASLGCTLAFLLGSEPLHAAINTVAFAALIIVPPLCMLSQLAKKQ